MSKPMETKAVEALCSRARALAPDHLLELAQRAEYELGALLGEIERLRKRVAAYREAVVFIAEDAICREPMHPCDTTTRAVHDLCPHCYCRRLLATLGAEAR